MGRTTREESAVAKQRPHRGGRSTEKAGEGPSVRAERTTEMEGRSQSIRQGGRGRAQGCKNLPDLRREGRYLLWVHPVALFQSFRVLLVNNEFVLHHSPVPKPSLWEGLRYRKPTSLGKGFPTKPSAARPAYRTDRLLLPPGPPTLYQRPLHSCPCFWVFSNSYCSTQSHADKAPGDKPSGHKHLR